MSKSTSKPKRPAKKKAGGGCHGASCSSLTGYQAATIQIQNLIKSAQESIPKRLKRGYQKRAEYRQGYYDAIVHAYCFMAYGEFPDHPENAARISEIMKTNAESIHHELKP